MNDLVVLLIFIPFLLLYLLMFLSLSLLFFYSDHNYLLVNGKKKRRCNDAITTTVFSVCFFFFLFPYFQDAIVWQGSCSVTQRILDFVRPAQHQTHWTHHQLPDQLCICEFILLRVLLPCQNHFSLIAVCSFRPPPLAPTSPPAPQICHQPSLRTNGVHPNRLSDHRRSICVKSVTWSSDRAPNRLCSAFSAVFCPSCRRSNRKRWSRPRSTPWSRASRWCWWSRRWHTSNRRSQVNGRRCSDSRRWHWCVGKSNYS